MSPVILAWALLDKPDGFAGRPQDDLVNKVEERVLTATSPARP
jgi:hypothetical protein